MSNKKYLKGFANLGFIAVAANDGETYSTDSTYHSVPGAVECSKTDNREDYKILADDGVWDNGAEWDDSDIEITVVESDLETISYLTGATYENGVLEEGTLDEPPLVALTFSALRADNSYRLFRYYCCKCVDFSVSSHTTKGQNKDAQSYTLKFKVTPRKIDQRVRGTKDINAGDSLSWLRSVS